LPGSRRYVTAGGAAYNSNTVTSQPLARQRLSPRVISARRSVRWRPAAMSPRG